MKLFSRFGFLKNPSSSKSKNEYFVIFVLPVILMLAVMVLNIFINFFANKQQLENNIGHVLNLFSLHCEEKISSLLNNTVFFESDISVSALLDRKTPFDAESTEPVQNMLNIFEKSNPLIDTVAVFSKKADKVITSDGIYTISEFFAEQYVIDGYTDSYFKNFRFYDNSSYRIISPSKVVTPDSEKVIIPIVVRKISKSYINFIFISVSFTKLFQSDMSSVSFTNGSEMFMLNNYTGMVYTPTDNEGTDITNTEIYSNLLQNKASFDSTSSNGKKNLVLSYAPRNSILGYTYYVQVPYKDIYLYQRNSIIITITLSVIIFLYAFFVTFRSSNELVSSLLNIRKILSKDNHSDKSLLSNITTSAISIVNEYNSMNDILTYAHEQYLIDFLNHRESGVSASTAELLTKKLPFRHNLYKTIIIQILPTKQLTSLYTPDTYSHIIREVMDTIKVLWINDLEVFFISSENNTLYTLINTDNPEVDTLCDEICAKIEELLKNDSDLIDLIIGKGSVYTGIQGLKQSHDEAINKLNHVFPLKSFIKIPVKSSLHSLTYEVESKFFVALMGNDSEKAISIINEFLQMNHSGSDSELKQIYSQIIETVLRAMRNKKVAFPDSLTELDIRSKLTTETTDTIYKLITVLINTFTNSQKTRRIDTTEIISYIKENYTDSSMSLDKIAQITGTDAKYCSSLIKTTLGIGFHDYLTNLRIEHAKELLRSGDSSMQDIWESCGFTNRQTFTRAFKKITGITAYEYKKNY